LIGGFLMIKDKRVLLYLQNLLEYEKEQMEKAEVQIDFFEYSAIRQWLDELETRIKK
jgi:hypothetical protein